MTNEGIFFAPRDDTGIIAFVLVLYKIYKEIPLDLDMFRTLIFYKKEGFACVKEAF
jgi:hypothetical protein